MDIGRIIADLLYQYDTVVLPSLGGLTLTEEGVRANTTKNSLQPPRKTVSFNPNLQMNDGLLIHQLRQRYQVPQETAESLAHTFINDIKETLQKGEKFILTDVGSFYANGEQIQFAPANTNYDVQSYGLPEVETPVITRAEGKIAFERLAEKPSKEPLTSTVARSFSMGWMVAAASVLVVALLLYTFRDDLFQEKTTLRDDLEDRTPINQRPSNEGTASETALVQPLDEDELTERDEPTPLPNQKVKRIVVGAFSERKNAEKLAKRIQLAGYTPFSETRNNKRYVGIAYSYTRESEFERTLSAIKKEFSSSAWVLEE